MTKRAIALVLGLIAVLATLSLMHVYVAWETHRAQLFWTKDEAYVFMNGGQIGWRSTYLYQPVALLRAMLMMPGKEDDARTWVTVFHATDRN